MTSSTNRALIAERTKEIVNLHLGIEASLRRSVQDAIKLGELLAAQKEALPHGDFLPWIERELPFNERTAQRYMMLFRYKSKCDTLSDLRTAYEVAQIEDQRRHPKARPADPEAVEQQRQRHEAFVRRIKEEPAPEPEPRIDYDAVLKKAREAQERPVIERMDTGDGPLVVAEHLGEYIDAALALLPDELSRHQVINALIKRLRGKSIQLNRKVDVA